jgi:hypothetical protein
MPFGIAGRRNLRGVEPAVYPVPAAGRQFDEKPSYHRRAIAMPRRAMCPDGVGGIRKDAQRALLQAVGATGRRDRGQTEQVGLDKLTADRMQEVHKRSPEQPAQG